MRQMRGMGRSGAGAGMPECDPKGRERMSIQRVRNVTDEVYEACTCARMHSGTRKSLSHTDVVHGLLAETFERPVGDRSARRDALFTLVTFRSCEPHAGRRIWKPRSVEVKPRV